MANSYLTSSVVLGRALAVLSQKVTFLDKVNRQYDNAFDGTGAKYGPYGDTVRVRVPQRAVIRTGRVMDVQPNTDRVVSVALSQYKGVDTGATTLEMKLDINDFQAQYIDPKIPDLVAAVEADVIATCLPQVAMTAGSYGAFTDPKIALSAKRFLDNGLAPNDERYMLVNSGSQVDIVNALTGFFNPQATIGDQYKKGMMSKDTLGFDWFTTSLMPSYTTGAHSGTYVLNGVPANGATTAVVATGTGSMVVGDVFTIAGCNAVQPQTKADLGYLQQFTVTAAYAGGAGTISFSPAIFYSPDWQQNVTAAPVSNAAITFKGTASTKYFENVAFAPDAFYFVTADLPKPPSTMGVDVAVKTWGGIRMRYMQGFDIVNDQFLSRFDIAYGCGILRPELAVRIPATVS